MRALKALKKVLAWTLFPILCITMICTGAAGVEQVPSAEWVGPSPLEPYEHWIVKRGGRGPLDVYIARKDENERKPLIIFIQGSKCFPLLMVSKKDGKTRVRSTLLFYGEEDKLLPQAHFALVERRGLKSFGPPPASEEEVARMAHCTSEHGGVSKDERVADFADVVRAFSKQPWVDGVFVLGHSEGAYVAGGVAKALDDGSLSGAGMLSGPGPTQLFDFIVQARRDGDVAEVKKVFDELLWLTGPKPTGEYRGADVERQLSYGIRSTSIDDLRNSRVPLFVANGDKDDKAPIESADVFVAEMLRDPGRKLRYVMLPGLGHDYSDSAGKEHAAKVLAAFLDWALMKEKPRDVIVGLSSLDESQASCASLAHKPIGGGEYLRTEDGAELWHKVAGNPNGPVVVYLHGGPGYNSYAFEKAVGKSLAPHLRMVYLDQRGCGRSGLLERNTDLGMGPTVEDVERLRKHLGAPKISLIGHSFGALVALEYVKAHRAHVDRVVLVEGLADIPSALQHQLETLAYWSDDFPQYAKTLMELARSKKSPFEKIEAAYALLGPLVLQRKLHYASASGQEHNELWDQESGLRSCESSAAVVRKYMKDGYLDSRHSDLMQPLPAPGILFAGRKSNVIGASNIETAAKALHIPVRWFGKSGHFIYAEEPKEFSDSAIRFLTSPRSEEHQPSSKAR